jgi:hypothetical protein
MHQIAHRPGPDRSLQVDEDTPPRRLLVMMITVLLEVDGAALAIGQAAVVEHLQQHVEDIAGGPSRPRRTTSPE